MKVRVVVWGKKGYTERYECSREEAALLPYAEDLDALDRIADLIGKAELPGVGVRRPWCLDDSIDAVYSLNKERKHES